MEDDHDATPPTSTNEGHQIARHDTNTDRGDDDSGMQQMYLRFAAMILTGMVVMYWVMFTGSWEWSHVQFSQSRVFMALTMGGTMGLVMLAWMLNMYKNTMANIIVIVVSLLLITVGIVLDRTHS